MTAPSSPTKSPVVLVVDDEESLIDMISTALRFNGFDPLVASTGRAAFASVQKHRPDLVILDVNLPDDDGFEVCRKMRAYGFEVPVIFLTARAEPDAVRTGFQQGGDDYLSKPFRIDELVLRINAVLRRVGSQRAAPEVMTCGDLTVNDKSMRVLRGDVDIALSPTEFRLLSYLMVNRDTVVSKYQILENVWLDESETASTLVETYIGYLRKKVDLYGPSLIHTVRGSGYVLRTPLEIQ